MKAALKFSGYASVYNQVDSHDDIIRPGAFEHCLNKPYFPFLWQHKTLEKIGRINSAFENKYGLYVTGEIQFATPRAEEAYKLIHSLACTGLSVGFIVKEYTRCEKTNVRVITKADLWEISLVVMPANNKCRINYLATETNIKTITLFPG